MIFQTIDTTVKILTVALLSGTVFYVYHLREETKRLQGDVDGLNVAIKAQMDTTRNAQGQMRATVQTIVLSQDEARKYLSKDIADLKSEFGVRIKGLRTYIETSMTYRIPVVAPGRDTVINNKTEKVYYLDGRYRGRLFSKDDTLLGSITIGDTVRITVSKGKRERWWKFWEKRPTVTNAYLVNPDGTITSLKSVSTP